jgi:hypothetical protein
VSCRQAQIVLIGRIVTLRESCANSIAFHSRRRPREPDRGKDGPDLTDRWTPRQSSRRRIDRSRTRIDVGMAVSGAPLKRDVARVQIVIFRVGHDVVHAHFGRGIDVGKRDRSSLEHSPKRLERHSRAFAFLASCSIPCYTASGDRLVGRVWARFYVRTALVSLPGPVNAACR